MNGDRSGGAPTGNEGSLTGWARSYYYYSITAVLTILNYWNVIVIELLLLLLLLPPSLPPSFLPSYLPSFNPRLLLLLLLQ